MDRRAAAAQQQLAVGSGADPQVLEQLFLFQQSGAADLSGDGWLINPAKAAAQKQQETAAATKETDEKKSSSSNRGWKPPHIEKRKLAPPRIKKKKKATTMRRATSTNYVSPQEYNRLFWEAHGLSSSATEEEKEAEEVAVE